MNLTRIDAPELEPREAAIAMRNLPLALRDRLIADAPNVIDGRGRYWRRAHGGDPR